MSENQSRLELILLNGWNLLKSMRFAIILLIVLTVASIINLFSGEFVSLAGTGQELSRSVFTQIYGPLKGNLLYFFQMDSPYESWWFTTLLALLLLSLTICVIDRTSIVFRLAFPSGGSRESDSNQIHQVLDENQVAWPKIMLDLLSGMGYNSSLKFVDNKVIVRGFKHTLAHLGPWLVHIGFILLVIGGAMIARGKFTTTVSGMPGEILTTRGGMEPWDFRVRVDDFLIKYYPLQVKQIVMLDEHHLGKIIAENTDSTFDIEIYQPEYQILRHVSSDRLKNHFDRWYSGGRLDQPNIADYIATLTVIEDGKEIRTEQVEVNHPLRYKGYRFYQSSFDDSRTDAEGRWTTVLQVRKDRGSPFVWTGIIIVSLGLMLGLYMVPRSIVITISKGKWDLLLTAKRNKTLFLREDKRIRNELENLLKS